MVQEAPGWPGISPRWTTSDKSGVGTAMSPFSRVWFTISHGILNEIYYPRVDQACTRDFGFLVSDGVSFFSEEKRDANDTVQTLEDGVPLFRLTNICANGRYRIEKCIFSDPDHDVVLQSVSLHSLTGDKLRLFPLLAPHLVNGGRHNTAWVGDYKGMKMLFAEGDGTSIALAASVPWIARSAGFVGVSDGWQEVSRNFHLATTYDRASDGNVSLCGELDLSGLNGEPVILALGFGRSWSEAAFRVKSSLIAGFEPAQQRYIAGWRAWQDSLRPLDRLAKSTGHNSYRVSTAVLRTHDSPMFPGGVIASLSIPWGYNKSDDDLGGYHLVWPRDLVETAGALIACGANDDALRVLDYLRIIQEADGSWPQNTWLDGLPYWRGIQLDECAFPILLADMARRNGLLTEAQLAGYWDMVRRAAGYVMFKGPITGQDRWEEDGGFSPFTLGVEIAALLAAADMADSYGTDAEATLLRDTADLWNDSIESWTYASGTPLAQRLGIDGYYVRIAPVEGVSGEVTIKNRPADDSLLQASEVVSPDALALVRFGLRAANDPRMENTVRAIDALLKVDLPDGPSWHRYNDDGYGEHSDGSAFDGTGIGRAWPLLTGGRAHYALAAGDVDGARHLLETLEALTSRGGLIPEQVWDTDDIPARELRLGRPSGSAMPLVWAHGEHIKLCRSLADGRVFDMPPQTVARYIDAETKPRCAIWRNDLQITSMAAGRALRIDLAEPATVRWTMDAWQTQADIETTDTGLGLFSAELPPVKAGTIFVFTYRDTETGDWTGQNYSVTVSG